MRVRAPTRNMISKIRKDLAKYLPYSLEETRATLLAEVSTMHLGWLWWILTPLSQMLAYMIIFGFIFNARTEYYPAFIFIGIAAWRFFAGNLTSSAKLIRSYKAMLRKVYLPRFILVLTQLLCNGFRMLVAFCLVFALMVLYRIPPTLSMLSIVPLLVLLAVLSFGSSALSLHVGVYWNDLENLLPVALRLIMYFTGIFYSISDLIPGKLGFLAIHLNPLAFIMDSLREVLLFGGTVEWGWFWLWLIVGIAVCWVSLAILYRYGNRYLKVV